MSSRVLFSLASMPSHSPPRWPLEMMQVKGIMCGLPSSGLLPPRLSEPPPPCGAAGPRGAAAQRRAGASVERRGSNPAAQDGRAPTDRHQPEPKRQQRHLPLPGVAASERLGAQSGAPSFLRQPPDLQGPSSSARLRSTKQARPPQRQWRRKQAHVPVRAPSRSGAPPRPALLPSAQCCQAA